MPISPSAQVVLDGFDKYLKNIGHHVDDLGREFKERVKTAIRFVGAIDTGAMINAIDYTRSFVVDDGYAFWVGAVKNPEVFYDGFVEFPTMNKDGSGPRPGKYFYEQGIENADVHRIFNEIAQESFVTY